MAFPPLPDFLETPWYDEFVAWAAAVESGLDAARPRSGADEIAAMLGFRDRSLRVGIASDSTGNDVNDWPMLWLKRLTRDTWLRIQHRTWNATTLTLDPLATIQAGTGGSPASGGVVLADNFNRSGNVPGSTSSGGQVWEGENGNWVADGSHARGGVTTSLIRYDAGSATQRLTVSLDIPVPDSGVTTQMTFWVGATANRSNGVWLSVYRGASTTVQMFRTISGVPTSFGPLDSSLSTGTATHMDIVLDLAIQNASASITTPEKTVTLTGTLPEADVSKLGTRTVLQSLNTPLIAVDSVQVETPLIPAVPGPGITLYNGSAGGAKLSYQTAHFAAMWPDPLDVMIISTGHNNGAQDAATFRAEVEAFVELTRITWPECRIVLSSQNPQVAPAAGVVTHGARQAAMRALARDAGYDYIPTYEAFTAQPDGGVSLISPDGVHPTTPPSPYNPDAGFGATFWADTWLQVIDAH